MAQVASRYNNEPNLLNPNELANHMEERLYTTLDKFFGTQSKEVANNGQYNNYVQPAQNYYSNSNSQAQSSGFNGVMGRLGGALGAAGGGLAGMSAAGMGGGMLSSIIGSGAVATAGKALGAGIAMAGLPVAAPLVIGGGLVAGGLAGMAAGKIGGAILQHGPGMADGTFSMAGQALKGVMGALGRGSIAASRAVYRGMGSGSGMGAVRGMNLSVGRNELAAKPTREMSKQDKFIDGLKKDFADGKDIGKEAAKGLSGNLSHKQKKAVMGLMGDNALRQSVTGGKLNTEKAQKNIMGMKELSDKQKASLIKATDSRMKEHFKDFNIGKNGELIGGKENPLHGEKVEAKQPKAQKNKTEKVVSQEETKTVDNKMQRVRQEASRQAKAAAVKKGRESDQKLQQEFKSQRGKQQTLQKASQQQKQSKQNPQSKNQSSANTGEQRQTRSKGK